MDVKSVLLFSPAYPAQVHTHEIECPTEYFVALPTKWPSPCAESLLCLATCLSTSERTYRRIHPLALDTCQS